MFGVDKIQNFLPHRYPFLLVDRVLECEPGKRLLGLKNVSINEPWVTGHFPSKAIFPGVLIIEALAQATGLLASETAPELVESGMIYYLVGIDKVRFKQPVYPGDQLHLEVEYLRNKRNIWVFDCTATVEGTRIASAHIMCAAAKP